MESKTTESPTRSDLHLRSYLARWWHAIIHLDGPTWSTLRALLRSPGRLAAAHCDADPTDRLTHSAIHPVRLYLTINIVFFFLSPLLSTGSGETLQVTAWHVEHAPVVKMQPLLGEWLDRRIEASGLDEGLYRRIFDHRMSALQGAWVFIWIPILALAGFMVYRRRRRFLVEHMIFATHTMAFFLAAVLAVSLVLRLVFLLPEKPAAILSVVAILSWILWLSVTAYRSVRTFHDLKSHWATALFSAWLMFSFIASSMIYLQILFLSTLFDLRGLSVIG